MWSLTQLKKILLCTYKVYVTNTKSGDQANKIILLVILLPNAIIPPETVQMSLRQGRRKMKSFIFRLIFSWNSQAHAGVLSYKIYPGFPDVQSHFNLYISSS